jgi:hypothetical protein
MLRTDVANHIEGYVESGYVGWIREEVLVKNTV